MTLALVTLGVLALLALLAVGGDSTETKRKFGSGGLGRSREELLANKPDDVPQDVWRWRPLAWELAEEINYPMDPDIALAIWWRETLGSDDTPDTPEKGVGQVLEIAVEDVNQNTSYSIEWPPRNDRREALASMLYDKVNYERVGQPKIRKTIRSHNEGPPPHNQPEAAEYASDVLRFHRRIEGREGANA